MTPAEVLRLCRENDVKAVDLRFVDLHGIWHHTTIPVKKLVEEVFETGLGFDGSSIRGWQTINESDMLMIPQANTAFIDPFTELPTLNLICNIQDPITGEDYSRDPRNIVQKAANYLQASGVADKAFFGPEAEFFIFDDIRFDQNEREGYYQIDSVEGQGTTVRIYLPRTYETISGDLKSEAAEQGNPSGNETILVVEDESDVLNYIVKALNRFGYNMLQAKDGPTALEVMASCDTIDLLLTDVILPQGMNGREIADAFQRQFPTACVLYSSGYTREVLGQRSQIDDHMVLINKPYGRHVLARQVREILDDRQKEDIL